MNPVAPRASIVPKVRFRSGWVLIFLVYPPRISDPNAG